MRRKHFKRLAANFEDRAAAHRESYPIPPSPCGLQYWNYIRNALRFWTEGINVYTQSTYSKMAFDKYVHTQRVNDKILKKLTNKESSILFIGGAEFSPNSPIKGHVRCPGVRKIIKNARKFPNVDYVFVDEYMTSQHCGKCNYRFDQDTRKDRFKQCPSCIPVPQLSPVPDLITTPTPRIFLQRIMRRKRLDPGYDSYNDKSTTWSKNTDDNTSLTPTPTIWHRDICAARLIGHKGKTFK